VDEDAANADLIADRNRSNYRIAEQVGAQTLPLKPMLNGQPGQEYHRNGMPRQPFLQSLRSLIVLDRRDRQRIVTGDLAFAQGDVRARRMAPLAGQAELRQESIQSIVATIELVDRMLG